MATLPAPGTQAPLLPPGKLELKYLFCVQFKDGSVIEQTSEDVSPTTAGRNAFYDLLECHTDGKPKQHPEDGKLICRADIALFHLENVAGQRWLVDLTDGHFETQFMRGKHLIGTHFFTAIPPKGAPLRLFYFRRRRSHINVAGTVQADKTVKLSSAVETSQECEYHFGWETLDKTHSTGLILV